MRALIFAGAFGLAFNLFLMPLFIRLTHKLGWGQFIREDGPQTHLTKRGTPTMGGVVIVIGTLLAYFFGKLTTGSLITSSGLLALFLMAGLALVGFVDDFMKVRHHQSLGLSGWAKLGGQLIVAVAFGLMALLLPADKHGMTPASPNISFIRDLPIDIMKLGPVIGIIVFLIWIYAIVASASNGVNVTDGLDGLATGASIFSVGSYMFLTFWQFNQWCWYPGQHADPATTGCYVVAAPLDLAVVSAALLGSLIGFLWWNTSPAKIFMGDTGSLGIGGAIAALAILSRTELLLIFLGGLYVITAGSVILQRVYFKLTHGKRIFLMSPLHHHFELKGWAPVTVVIRFWIIAGLLASIGLALFYFEWVTNI